MSTKLILTNYKNFKCGVKLNEGELVNIRFQPNEDVQIGDIYKVKITEILPNDSGAFVTYGKGDRLKEDGTPLNLIQIECQGKAVDMVSEEELEKCRGDDSLVEMKYGWMDFATYKGWRAYHAECHVCHGPDAMGSTYAPSLMVSVQNGMTWDAFFDVIINGRGVDEGAQKGNVMPAFGENTNVAPHIEDMFRYVKARADGKIRRGVRLPKLPKFKEE